MILSDEEVISYLKTHFTYHANGTFTRSDRKNSHGSYDKDGYLIIKIKGRQYKSHRLVYAFHFGEFPPGELDHINRVRDDNRIENLRNATRFQNVRNSVIEVNPDTGVRGVHFDRCTKGLKSRYTTKLGKKTYRFRTLEEAVKKRREYYGNAERMYKDERTS